MTLEKTDIPGLFIICIKKKIDTRGSFFKPYSDISIKNNNINFEPKEFYYTISHKDVIRGMHFQIPPYDHNKIVFVNKGRIKDIVLDLRKKSPTYKQFFEIELDSESEKVLYIPKGIAHGFIASEDDTCVNYIQSSCYSSEHDCGILYNSFGYDWKINNPILSERDKNFTELQNFNTPF